MSVTRLDSASAGTVDRIDIVSHTSVGGGLRRYITSVRDSHQDLKLISWTVPSGAGEIERRDSIEAGRVGDVAVANIGGGPVITAVQDSDQNLKVILYNVSSGPISNLFRVADASAGTVKALSATSIGGSENSLRSVTAVIDADDNLKVIVWDADGSPTAFVTRRGSASGGFVSEVSIAPVRVDTDIGFERVLTAVRDSDGNLKVIVWEIDTNGAISRLGSASAGMSSLICVDRLQSDRVCVAVRDSEGNLKVIIWDVDEAGNPQRRGDASAGAVDRVAISTSNTAVRDASGHLKVIQWNVDAAGNVVRQDDAQAGDVSLIRFDGSVTAVRDSGGNLKLINWSIS